MNDQLKTDIRQLIDDTNAVRNAVIATGVEVADGTPSSQYADKVAEVYEKGKSEGGGSGGDTDAAYNEGYEQGKVDEQRAFWEAYQEGGIVKSYASAFYNKSWTDEIYNPIYPIKTTNPGAMFYEPQITDTKVDIDISEATATVNMFRLAMSMKTVRKLIVSENTTYNMTFATMRALENITFEGVIGQNGMSFANSPLLTKASLTNIVEHTSTTATITITLSLKAVNKAFETSEGANDGSTNAEWLTLIGTRENVTITLA